MNNITNLSFSKRRAVIFAKDIVEIQRNLGEETLFLVQKGTEEFLRKLNKVLQKSGPNKKGREILKISYQTAKSCKEMWRSLDETFENQKTSINLIKKMIKDLLREENADWVLSREEKIVNSAAEVYEEVLKSFNLIDKIKKPQSLIEQEKEREMEVSIENKKKEEVILQEAMADEEVKEICEKDRKEIKERIESTLMELVEVLINKWYELPLKHQDELSTLLLNSDFEGGFNSLKEASDADFVEKIKTLLLALAKDTDSEFFDPIWQKAQRQINYLLLN